MTENSILEGNIKTFQNEIKRGKTTNSEVHLPLLYEAFLIEHPDCLEDAINAYCENKGLGKPKTIEDLNLIESFRPKVRWSKGENPTKNQINETLEILNIAIKRVEKSKT